MKIKLIAPKRKLEWEQSFWDLKSLCKLIGREAGGAPLALPTLAALTPLDVDVVLTDENVEPINFEEKVDLVGITGMTCLIPRSYEIADEYRKRGVPVVIGGIHASMLSEEAIQHCDSVVVGEAEEIWEQVVRDGQKKNLQKFYRSSRFPDLTNSPIPRWDLLKNDKYCYFTIQTGRGCPFDGDFCSVKVFNGREYRHKKIEQVVKEIEMLQSIDHKKLMFFTDDNLLAIPKYTEELMRKIIPLKIKSWWCQSSVNRLKDGKMLDLMHEAGCRLVFVGFESISQKSLAAMNKSHVNKVEEYKETVNLVHSHKIAVFGSFILGGDDDDENIFEDTTKFIDNTNIAFSMINIMTPLPGSNLYKRFKHENRILDNDWERYNGELICFRPEIISHEILQKGYIFVYNTIYSYDNLYKRLYNLWSRSVFVRSNKSSLFGLFSKGRILLTIKSMFLNDKARRSFILRSLWNVYITSITNSVAIALNFHDYAENLCKNRIKDLK
ncbi:MAG: radical SAM protein [Candidatus Omnitrophica bacterium]|nr:radical SAM protein [Candidatus Omnitrophota bacterium]